jgi:hypothetical protein
MQMAPKLRTSPIAALPLSLIYQALSFGLNVADPSTFGHPVGFINPSSTIIPHSLWGELGARFTF